NSPALTCVLTFCAGYLELVVQPQRDFIEQRRERGAIGFTMAQLMEAAFQKRGEFLMPLLHVIAEFAGLLQQAVAEVALHAGATVVQVAKASVQVVAEFFKLTRLLADIVGALFALGSEPRFQSLEFAAYVLFELIQAAAMILSNLRGFLG